MKHLKVLKNSTQNALNQFYPSLSQRWKMMQILGGSWLLLSIESPFYCLCQKFLWPPPRYSQRALYWGIGLFGSIEISIAKASDYPVLTNLSPLLLWILWDSFRYSRTNFFFSDTSLRIFLICQLDPVASSTPPYLQAVASAATVFDRASTLTPISRIHLYVSSRAVSALLQAHKTQHLSTHRQTTYE